MRRTADGFTLFRAVKGFGVGLLVGPLLTGLWLNSMMLIHTQVTDQFFDGSLSEILSSILMLTLFPLALAIYSLFLWVPALLLAIPVWLVLHLIGLRGWPYYSFAGGIWGFVFGFGVSRVREFRIGPFFHNDPIYGRLESAVLIGLIGTLTAFLMWRAAYPTKSSD